jgi:hypothetical protein
MLKYNSGGKGMKKIGYFFLMIVVLTSFIFAGTSGKITGTITDEKTNEPLSGANVYLEGTTMGGITDANGYYVMLNIPVGMYNLKVTYIGYTPVTVQEVKVSIDLTTKIDLKLLPKVLQSKDEIIVIAERPLLKKDEFTSRHNVTAEEMEAQPVDDFTQIAQNQAGVVGSHFRGGRAGEVLVVIDGIPVRDPAGEYSGGLGGFTGNVPDGSIQEMEVILGGFGAEYGNVQSGIINLAMKEGGQKFSGKFKMISTNFSEGINDALMGKPDSGWYDLHYQHYLKNIYQLNLSGPIPLIPATFSFSTELTDKDQGYFINEQSENRSFQGKITYKISPKIKFAIGGLYSYSEWDQFYFPASKYGPGKKYQYDHYEYMDDTTWVKYFYVNDPFDTSKYTQGSFIDSSGEYYTFINDSTTDTTKYSNIQEYYVGGMQDYLWNREQESRNLYAIWTHSLSSKTFYEIRYQNAYSNYHYATPDVEDRDGDGDREEDLVWDINKDGPHPIYREREDNYWWLRGDDPGYRDQTSLSHTFKGDLTSQVSENHLIKTGFELGIHKTDVENISWTLNLSSVRKDIWEQSVIDFGVYAQDKMEFKGLIALIGLRYDYFNPNGFNDPIYFPADYEYPYSSVDSTGLAILTNPQEATVKAQISPRIAISHPLTDKVVLYFTYGHFFQRPDNYYLFRNNGFQSLTKVGNYIGNPDLEPEKTVSYTVGIEHLFTKNIKGSVTGYYKDVTNLMNWYKYIGRSIQNTELNVYTNADYGNIKGLELSLKKRLEKFIGASVNYTYSVAKGRSSGPTGGSGTFTSAKTMNILSYDQTHTVNANVTLMVPKEYNVLIRNWRANFQIEYGSGLPYTSYGAETVNDQRLPYTFNTDMRLNRRFEISKFKVNAFFDIFNLFDRQNVDWIGSSQYYGKEGDASIVRQELSGEYVRNPQTYSSERQFRFGISTEF